MFVGNELNDKAPGGRPMRWCFVLLSVALGTQFLSSYPSTSALPTRGWSYGTPRDSDRNFSLSMRHNLVRASHSIIRIRMILDTYERFYDMGVHIGAVRREADFPTVVCSA